MDAEAKSRDRAQDNQPERSARAVAHGIGLRGRVVVAAVIGIALNAWLLTEVEMVRFIALGSMWSLSPLVLTETLLALLLFTPLRRSERWRWRARDFLALYILLTLGTAPISFDGAFALTGLLAFPSSPLAHPPDWRSEWLASLPPRLLVTDTLAANAAVLGNHAFWSEGLWVAWIKPLAGWTGLLATLSMVYLGLSCLLHRRWSQQQRLAYPLATLPVALFAEDPPLWRRRAFWSGAALAAGLATLNRWQPLFPFLPSIPVDIRQIPCPFPLPPWSALGDIFIGCPLWMFGMAFLAPLDVLFSTVLCYWMWRLELVGAAFAGRGDVNGVYGSAGGLYLNHISYGAYLGLGIGALWSARRHLLWGFRKLPDRQASEDRETAISYRLAASLVGLGILGLWGWSLWLGLSASFAFAFFCLMLLTAVALGRIRAELGVVAYGMLGMAPVQMLAGTIGATSLTQVDQVVGMQLLNYGLTYGQRSNLMPLQVEALKVAERGGGVGRPLMVGMLCAAVLGIGLGLLAAGMALTRHGAMSGQSVQPSYTVFTWATDRLNSWAENPRQFGFNPAATLAVGVGVGITQLLFLLRTNFLAFPLHPIGFAIASDYNCHFFWMAFTLAWLVKGALLRYGGLRAYRRMLPFCLGLIVGDFVMMVVNGLLLAALGVKPQELTM